jgi:hypothetical protein
MERQKTCHRTKSSVYGRNKKLAYGLYPIFFLFIILVNGITSCKKLVEVNAPTTSNSSASVYQSDATAIAAVTTLYAKLSIGGPSAPGPISSLSAYGGLSSDELSLFTSVTNPTQIAYYKNNLRSTSGGGAGFEYWETTWPFIYTCNEAINGLNTSNSLTPAIKKQLLGEAKFMRAFYYFYLVNLYGDVPLVLTTDYKVNSALSRTPPNVIYQQIITDLKEAQSTLSASYLDGSLLNTTIDRVRPTVGAATALMARVYLYYGNLTNDVTNYSSAESQASLVISNSSLYNLSALTNVFARSSLGNKEAIWQLQPINTGWNTEDGKYFIVPSTGIKTGTNVGLLISNQLLNSFEVGDNRKSNWIGSVTILGKIYYYPFKYKIGTQSSTSSPIPVTEHLMVLRVGEQYLIRAEARAQQGNITGAQTDLNIIRTRAGLPGTTANDKATLLTAIAHERQVELFTEWGHRWLDLKRIGSVDAVMGAGGVCAAKGGTWNTNWQLYPILFRDIQSDPKLVQNSGY